MTECAQLRFLWVFGALLMTLDGLSTWIALRLGLYEINPLARWIMSHIGVAGDCILKVLVCIPVVWAMAVIADWGIRRGSHFVRRSATIVLAATVVLMSAVVTNNFTQIAITLRT